MTRFSKKYFYYSLIINVIFSVFIVTMFFLEVGTIEMMWLSLIIAVCIFVCLSVYSYLFYLKSGYCINETQIRCKRGVLFKKESIVDFDKMHAISKKQNIIQKLFKISVLTVDSGSTNTAHIAEIRIVEDDAVVERLISQLKSIQKNGYVKNDKTTGEYVDDSNEEVENLYQFTSGKIVIYSLLNAALGFIVMSLLFIILFVIFAFVSAVYTLEGAPTVLQLLLILISSFIGFNVLSFSLSFLNSFLKYYDYKIVRKDGQLLISYGLLVKNAHTLKVSRVKAVKINQGLIKTLFGYVSIYLEVIGYGDASKNEQSTGILIPLCKKTEVELYLSKILPDYIPLKEDSKSKMLAPYLCWSSVFTSIIFAFAFLFPLSMVIILDNSIQAIMLTFLIGFIILGIMLLLTILDGYMEYKTSSISYDNEKITLYQGGFIKNCVVIRKENLIAIQNITTHFRQKHDIYSYKIHFRTNARTNVVVVKFLDKKLIEELDTLIKY